MCGIQGKRIQPIVKELHDEKIDVIEWNPDPALFISKAISPAKVIGVYLGGGKTATVVVPEDQLSLAIGRDGQNARLAAKLTGWRIDIKSVTEAAADLVNIYETKRDLIEYNEESGERTVVVTFKELFEGEDKNIDLIRVILSKRNDSRILSADENETLNRFVDRIEKHKVAGFNESTVTEVIKSLIEKKLSIDEVTKKSVGDSGLPKHVASILQNVGLRTFGDLYDRMKTDPDGIFKLQGISTKSMNEIASLVKFIGSAVNAEIEPGLSETSTVDETSIKVETVADAGGLETEEVVETSEDITAKDNFIDLTQIPVEQVVSEQIPEETEEVSFDELFNTIRSDVIPHIEFSDEEEEDRDDPSSTKDKKKKKKKNTEVEYDPEKDMTLVRKKHKRGDDADWGW